MSEPLVSVGLPVYNGERYLREALDSLLVQTLRDFEIVVSDNASTDRTWEICRQYAERDARIRIVRNERNRGIVWNFNQVFKLSRGRFFRWAAHDDLSAPEFLERCVRALEEDPGAVLAYPRAITIDENGRQVGPRPYRPKAMLPRPEDRFREIILFSPGSPAIYGVIRSDVLRRTPLHGCFYASDIVLLAELALHGRFVEVPAELLFHREHGGRTVNTYPTRHEIVRIYDPENQHRLVFPDWRTLGEYGKAVWRAPITWTQRLHCCRHLVRWVVAFGRYRRLAEDIAIAVRELLQRRPPVRVLR